MTEKKTTLGVPQAYKVLLEDIRNLQSDSNNPNKMTNKQKAEVWKSLQKHGWIYPVVTDLQGVFSDGEQRVQVCKDHGEFFAPVLRLSLSDPQRRLLRQTLNKLKGKHNRQLDEADYKRIIDAGEKDDLQALLTAVGERIPEDLGGPREGSLLIPESYELIIGGFLDESEQLLVFKKLEDPEVRRLLGLKAHNNVRVLNL
jgi:hypothetical protein